MYTKRIGEGDQHVLLQHASITIRIPGDNIRMHVCAAHCCNEYELGFFRSDLFRLECRTHYESFHVSSNSDYVHLHIARIGAVRK